jgi:hypothetical protein
MRQKPEITRHAIATYRYIVCFAQRSRRVRAMSLVRLLGFRTLKCGCVIGRYRELATSREVSYVEEKGGACEAHAHRRNHTIHEPVPAPTPLASQAS